MNDPNLNMYHGTVPVPVPVPVQRNSFKLRVEDYDDLCNECNNATISECCDKCGNGVCSGDKCGSLFPHHNRTNYVICSTCVDSIDKKLTVLVDYSKLVLLKKKIHKRLDRTIKTIGK